MRLAAALSPRSGDVDFQYGMALAHLDRWEAARGALTAGSRVCAGDKRFPIELAGIAFQQKQYPQAANLLREALKLDPADEYANDFAATVYLLMGNVDAALKYWNRVHKPYIASLAIDERLRINRLLLERAFAFSPAAVLTRDEFATTQARLQGLGVFPTYNVALSARPDGAFAAELHAIERDGFGSSRLQALVATFGGAAYETIYPSYFNLGRSATNIESLLRWDKEKRRLWLSLSGPVRMLPQRRWEASFDGRNENWNVRRSFLGTAPSQGFLNLERETGSFLWTGFPNGRLQWSTGAELSHRDYRNIVNGPAFTATLLSPGYELKHLASIQSKIVEMPERRFSIAAGASSELARLWSQPAHVFAKLQGSAQAHWFPQARGDTYEMAQRLRGGWTFGAAPFDELFMLGVERDSDLWLRGLVGTRDGQKGSSPLGYDYFLSNSTFYRQIYGNGLLSIKAGPLVDIGKMRAPAAGLSNGQWLFSTGVEARLAVLGTAVVLTYGRDLRAGSNAFYGALAR